MSERAFRLGMSTVVAAVALLPWAGAASQAPRPLPFAPGEECTYRGSGPLGRMGRGTMGVDGGQAMGGRETYLLRFDFRGRVGIAGIEDHTRSWLDPAEMASLRYTKRERSPVTSRDEDVQMNPATRRWTAARGGGAMPTSEPLDELSFIFYIRTLPLANGDVYSVNRHYEAGRNPVVIRVVRRGLTRVPAGEFRTVEVEMRVKDPAHYRGDGVVRFHFTDDARHVPVRIESAMPVGGRMVLSLETPAASCGAEPVAAHAAD